MAQNIELKAGHLVTFSTGEYSDYGYQGSYVALKDVAAEKMEEFAAVVKADADASQLIWGDLHSMFTAKLISEGCLAVIDMREIHIGSYGELELS